MMDDRLLQEQAAIAERLKLKWLRRMEQLLDEGTITSTDMNTLARVLMANGWVLDPDRLPKGLADKLGDYRVDPTKFSDDDPDVVPLYSYA